MQVKRPWQGKTACKLKRAAACVLPALVPQQLPAPTAAPSSHSKLGQPATVTEQDETVRLVSLALAPWLEKMLSSRLTGGLLKGREELMVFFKSKLL